MPHIIVLARLLQLILLIPNASTESLDDVKQNQLTTSRANRFGYGRGTFGGVKSSQKNLDNVQLWNQTVSRTMHTVQREGMDLTGVVASMGSTNLKGQWFHPDTEYQHQSLVDWAEKRLLNDLLEDYDKQARPVVDGITPVVAVTPTQSAQQLTVEFGLELLQLLDLDEMEQVLTTSVRSLYKWRDYNLVWDPADYDGIDSVSIPSEYIWVPDISLYNYADERLQERRPCDVRISSDGTVFWGPMAIFKSTCSVEIKYFPFDRQKCHMKFGPWSYDGFRVNISFYSGERNLRMTNFIDNPEWFILGSTAVFTEISYPCCPEKYPDISFHIWMKRQSAFYTYILIIPSVLLSSLTSVIFWLPPETPSKVVLAMNVFVAFLLLHLLLEDTTPAAASSFPLLGAYYCFNMGVITVSMFLCCITVNIHFHGSHNSTLPNWLRKVICFIGPKIMMNVNFLKTDKKGQQIPSSSHPESSDGPRNEQNPNTERCGFQWHSPWDSQSPDTGEILSSHGQPDHEGWPVRPQSCLPRANQYTLQQSNIDLMELCNLHSDSDREYNNHVNIPITSPYDQIDTQNNCVICMRDRFLYDSNPNLNPYPDNSPDRNPSNPSRGFRRRLNLQHPVTSDQRGRSVSLDDESSDPLRPNAFNAFPDNFSGENPTIQVSRKTQLKITRLKYNMNFIVKAVKQIETEQQDKEDQSHDMEQWRTVSLVLDRIFFIIYLLTLVVSSILFHPILVNFGDYFETEDFK